MSTVEPFSLDGNPTPHRPLDPATEAGAVASDASRPDATAPGAAPKRGRPKGSTNKSKPASVKRARVLEAQMLNRIFFSACANFGGDEMSPSDREREELDLALAEYIELKDGASIPPSIVLVLAYSNFILTKTAKPTVREKMMEKLKMAKGFFVVIGRVFKRKKKDETK